MKPINYSHQSGITLVISLVMLLLLTLVATTGMQNKEWSFQAAEDALVEAENWLLSLISPPVLQSNCASFPCVLANGVTNEPEQESDAWWNANGKSMDESLSFVHQQPMFVIEFLSFIPDTLGTNNNQKTGIYYYRITAKAQGSNSTSQTILQSILMVKF